MMRPDLPDMADLGQLEVPAFVFMLAEFLRWNDTTLQILKEMFGE